MKALCRSTAMAPGAMSREMERMIPTLSASPQWSERPCTAAHNADSRMQTAYLRLLIIKAEQQKIRHFTLITSVTSPAIITVWLNRRWLPRACRRKEYGQDVRLFDCNIQDQTCGKHARKNNPHTVSCLIRLLSFRYPVATAQILRRRMPL